MIENPSQKDLRRSLGLNFTTEQLEELRETLLLSERECYAAYVLELLIEKEVREP